MFHQPYSEKVRKILPNTQFVIFRHGTVFLLSDKKEAKEYTKDLNEAAIAHIQRITDDTDVQEVVLNISERSKQLVEEGGFMVTFKQPFHQFLIFCLDGKRTVQQIKMRLFADAKDQKITYSCLA